MKKLLLSLALLLAPTLASAQCNGVVPNGTICGNVTGTNNTMRPVSTSVLTGIPGGSNGQIQYNNAGAFGGFGPLTGDVGLTIPGAVTTITPLAVTTGKIANDAVTTAKVLNANITNAKLATGAANTVKGSLDGATTSDLAITSCSALYSITQWLSGTGWQCGINPVLPSRAVAATLDLSAFTSVRTLGYATAGDGGGATFLNRTTTPFRDQFITGLSITGTGTSGCTNGTYRNVKPTGGTGTNAILNVAANGTIVTTVEVRETGGNGYSVNDVLSTSITGCSTGVTFTVTSVSTPSCSFSDSVSNHWQIVYNETPTVNIRQCGAKVDYAGNDATATNDYTAIQNAISYAADIHAPTIDGGGSAGAKVVLPPGNALICGGVPLLVPQGVHIQGVNMWGSTIKICAAWGATANFMNICDPDTRASCFASYLEDFTLYAPFSLAGNAGVSAIYSNSIQQVDIINRVAVYAGRRRCLTLETGYGGAALLGIQNFECTPGDTSTTNPGIYINYGTTLVTMRNVHVETSGPNTMNGLEIDGGFVDLVGFHSEGITQPIMVEIPTSNNNGMVRIHSVTGGVSCVDLITRAAGSATNTLIAGHIVAGNGCTNTVNNAGAATTTSIVGDTVY